MYGLLNVDGCMWREGGGGYREKSAGVHGRGHTLKFLSLSVLIENWWFQLLQQCNST